VIGSQAELTSSSAIADTPCNYSVGQSWPKVEEYILQTLQVYLQPL